MMSVIVSVYWVDWVCVPPQVVDYGSNHITLGWPPPPDWRGFEGGGSLCYQLQWRERVPTHRGCKVQVRPPQDVYVWIRIT
jgi:hypothetical protein